MRLILHTCAVHNHKHDYQTGRQKNTPPPPHPRGVGINSPEGSLLTTEVGIFVKPASIMLK
jgi:hypothetical protein